MLLTAHVPLTLPCRSQGLNTGVFLLRKCDWSRQLMAEVAALATPSIRRQIGNKGRIAEQGALTWVLHSQVCRRPCSPVLPHRRWCLLPDSRGTRRTHERRSQGACVAGSPHTR